VNASILDGYVELCFDFGDDNANSAGDSILVEYNAGAGWQTAWSQDSQLGNDNSCYQVCVNLSDIDPAVNNNAALGISFTLSSDANKDEIAFDNVIVRGAQYCDGAGIVGLNPMPPTDDGLGWNSFDASAGSQLTTEITCTWDAAPVPVEDMDSVWFQP